MIELQIPLEIPSQNKTKSSRDWRVNAAMTKKTRRAWMMATWPQMLKQKLLAASGPRRLHVIAYRKRRCADTANLIGGAKACIDGIVDARALVDDKDTMARITYEQQVASKSPTGKPHTTLQFTEGI